MNSLIALLAAVLVLTIPARLTAQSNANTDAAPVEAVLAVSAPLPDVPQTNTEKELEQLKAEFQRHLEQEKDQLKPAPLPALNYSLSGQLRHRAELDGRTFIPGARSLGYQLLRSRVNFTVNPSQDAKIIIQLQDSRVFGAGSAAMNRGTQDGMSKAIDFHQAYFAIANTFGTPLQLTIGRQDLIYGNQRLVGVSNWNNVGTVFDAVTLQWKSDAVTMNAFRAKLVGNQSTIASENLTGAYGIFRYSPELNADLALLLDDNTAAIAKGTDKGSARLERYSSAMMFNGKLPMLEYEVETVLQRGSIALTDSSSLADIEAHLFAARISSVLSKEQNLRIGAKFQLLSGDPSQKSGSYATYNTLFSSLHAFYGFMDIFPKTLNEYGLRAISLHSGMNLSEVTNLTAEFFRYRTDANAALTDRTGKAVSLTSLGHELDLTVTHKYSGTISVTAGASAFLPGDAMRTLRGSAVSYWGHVMTVIVF